MEENLLVNTLVGGLDPSLCISSGTALAHTPASILQISELCQIQPQHTSCKRMVRAHELFAIFLRLAVNQKNGGKIALGICS